MANPKGRSLSELLAAVEARKAEAIRSRLGIPPSYRIEGLQLESLAYHLGERNGLVHIRLEQDAVRVAESQTAVGIAYRDDAARFLLEAWGISREQANAGISLELKDGKKVE